MIRISRSVGLCVAFSCIGALSWLGCPNNQGNGNNNVELPDGDNAGGDPNQGTPPAPWNTLTWSSQIIDTNAGAGKAAGYHGKLLRTSGGVLYYVFLKQMATTPDCDIAVFGGGSAPMIRYDLRVATVTPPSTSWTVETVPLDSSGLAPPGYINTRYGIGATLDSGGRLAMAVVAGGSGLGSCGSSDLVLAVRNGAASWGITAPVTDSSACCEYCEAEDPCGTDGSCECCFDAMQNACTTGTDMGAWAAIALCNTTLTVAFGDLHNFWDEDGQNYQGLELLQGSTVTGIRPWSGLGMYTAIACPSGNPIVATTGFKRGGLEVLRKNGAEWELKPTNPSFASWKIGERIQLALAADSTLGLAFQADENPSGASMNQLYYCASTDGGATWGQCEIVDTNVGGYPSLAFDKDNHPTVSYYYCGSGNCPLSSDRPRLAWRDGSAKWWKFDVSNEANNSAGQYSSLVIDPTTNAPTVAFMDLTRGAAVVATGKFD